jgi:hypothetical protein
MKYVAVVMALLLFATMANAEQYDENDFWAAEVAAIDVLDSDTLTIAKQTVDVNANEVLITYKWIGSDEMELATDLAAVTGIYVAMTQNFGCKIGDLRLVITDGNEKMTLRLPYSTARRTDLDNNKELLAAMVELLESAK